MRYRVPSDVAFVYGDDVITGDGGLYLMRTPDDPPYVLSGVGVIVWTLAAEGEHVAEAVARTTGQELETVRSDVEHFLTELVRMRLLTPLPTRSSP
jgi:hypothetical protein